MIGLLLSMNGDTLLGFLTEIASIASFCYHYTQLQASKNVPIFKQALLNPSALQLLLNDLLPKANEIEKKQIRAKLGRLCVNRKH